MSESQNTEQIFSPELDSLRSIFKSQVESSIRPDRESENAAYSEIQDAFFNTDRKTVVGVVVSVRGEQGDVQSLTSITTRGNTETSFDPSAERFKGVSEVKPGDIFIIKDEDESSGVIESFRLMPVDPEVKLGITRQIMYNIDKRSKQLHATI